MTKRRLHSVKKELLEKSKEAQLSAISIFNNPQINFKSENFIVLAVISWTYLLHAYFKDNNIDHRYFKRSEGNKRKKYYRTKEGGFKFLSLEDSLRHESCPLDSNTKQNLLFLIGIRHEIEHQMTTRIDHLLSARLQASVMNYEKYIVELFGKNNSIKQNISVALQINQVSRNQIDFMDQVKEIPKNINSFITKFDKSLTQDEFNSPHFAYRVLFVQKSVNRKGQADSVIEFVNPNSELAKNININYVAIKDREKNKWLPKQIVTEMKKDYPKFSMPAHTRLWQSKNAKSPGQNFGTLVANRAWYWYDTWVDEVRKHCEENKHLYL